jgi:hypothetical protein
VPDPRRRLPVLPRRHHEAPRAARDRRFRQDPCIDDFRIHIHAGDEVQPIYDRLLELQDHEGGRIAVSNDGGDVFVYASSYADAQRAGEAVHAIVREQNAEAEISSVERWLEAEERWSDEPAGDTWEAEEREEGYAPWEVRIDTGSRSAANELAEQLEQEGYRPLRRWSYLIVGTATREDAEELAARVHGRVEAGGEAVWETRPGNPFVIFGGLGE